MHMCCPPAKAAAGDSWRCVCGGDWLFMVRRGVAGWERVVLGVGRR